MVAHPLGNPCFSNIPNLCGLACIMGLANQSQHDDDGFLLLSTVV